MISTISETAIPPAVMNGTSATARPRIETTTVPPAKTTGRPAVATARPTDSSTVEPAREVLPVPGEHEQRVVDADAEPDHAAEHRCQGGDLDQRPPAATSSRLRGRARRPPCRSAARRRRANRTPGTGYDRGEEADQLARCPVAGSAKAKNRSPPISIRSGEPSCASVASSSRSSRSSAEVVQLRVLHPDDRDPAVGETPPRRPRPPRRARRVARAEHVRQVATVGLDRGQRGAALGRVEERRASSSGVTTTWAVIPACRCRRLDQFGRPAASPARARQRVLGLPAEGAGARRRRATRSDQPGRDHHPGMAGGEPAQAVQGFRHHRVLHRPPAPSVRPAHAPSLVADGVRGIGPRAGPASAIGRGGARPFGRSAAAAVPRLERGAENALRTLWAEPRAPDAPARVWRDWALVAACSCRGGPRRPRCATTSCGGRSRRRGGIAGVHPAVAAHPPAGDGRAGVRLRDPLRPRRAGRRPREPVGLYTRRCRPGAGYALLRWGSGRRGRDRAR